MKTKWLDRSLVVGPYLALVTSDAEFQKALDDCSIKPADRTPWIKNSTSDATAHYLENPSGELVCIVAIQVKAGKTGPQIAAMLVHEAVHVWQQFRDRIGETSPSAEFEAYAIQTISQRLMEAYSERLK